MISKTNKHKEKLIGFLLTGLLLFAASCKDATKDTVDCSTYNYSDCKTQEPYSANFHVKLTINSENTLVPITIYKGKLEENVIILRDTIAETTYDTLLPVNNYYTVTAKYKVGSTTVTAVDGDNVSNSHTKTCDSTCWSVTTGSAKVKLK